MDFENAGRIFRYYPQTHRRRGHLQTSMYIKFDSNQLKSQLRNIAANLKNRALLTTY